MHIVVIWITGFVGCSTLTVIYSDAVIEYCNVFLTAFVVKLLPLLSPVTLHHPTWSRRQPVSALPKQISSFSFCQSERDQFRNAPWKTKNLWFGFAVTVSMKKRRLSVFEACWNVLVCVQHLIIYTPSVCEVLLIKRVTKSFSSSCDVVLWSSSLSKTERLQTNTHHPAAVCLSSSCFCPQHQSVSIRTASAPGSDDPSALVGQRTGFRGFSWTQISREMVIKSTFWIKVEGLIVGRDAALPVVFFQLRPSTCDLQTLRCKCFKLL